MSISAPEQVSLYRALSHLADHAKILKRPLPIIETDLETACRLAELLASDLGCYRSDLTPRDPLERAVGVVAMFDGIKIVARLPRSCKHEVDGWREHFGPLADIWS